MTDNGGDGSPLELGTLSHAQPRDAWHDEARDFTPWLAEHIDLLSEALGIELVVVHREAPVGPFSADLPCRSIGSDGIERLVVVENQLDRTDHAHLGQLLTYAVGLAADIAVWISPEFRAEHRGALDWLNGRGGEDGAVFFGVDLELLLIDGSRPAPRFSVIAAPSGSRHAGGSAGTSDRGRAYQRFWRGLVERLHAERPDFSEADPERAPAANWTQFGAGGVGGFNLVVTFTADARFRVAIEILRGDRERNTAAFAALEAERDALERELGEPLSWEPLDEFVTSRVALYRDGSIESGADELAALARWAADVLPRMREVFGPRLRALDR